MGKKYEIIHLRDAGLARLTAAFPGPDPDFNVPFTRGNLKGIARYPGYLFDIVNLARETGINTILPSAYYLCASNLVRVSSAFVLSQYSN